MKGFQNFFTGNSMHLENSQVPSKAIQLEIIRNATHDTLWQSGNIAYREICAAYKEEKNLHEAQK